MLIDTRDIAEFASHVLADPPRHAGKTYTLTGPTSVSITDIATTLTDLLDAPISGQQIPADVASSNR